MVKIKGMNEEDCKGIKRGSRLAEIARRDFPECSVIGENSDPYRISVFLPGKKGILVYFRENLIVVTDESVFETAIRLAETYENNGESEFTIKKYYDE